ncbi:hypothetical protein D9Q98_007376 [Chlorella vulgaris]|uniref:NADH:flavin oxidoreductase/NADH oxidase N-terminal domain-containing protein n=1 Tax=Chlorella vulgaris TaxID=3077 RepID=A0A9D4TLB3_CHLVU|nr:hypothetical protein D9Q98_007376 [Chlorella vulgaris]
MTIAPTTHGSAAAAATAPLFTPYALPGNLQLKHRMVYAPLTRCRAFDQIPQPNAAQYYAQRSTPGTLLISEATCISDRAHGYPCTPGLYTEEQVEAWKPIVSAVHEKEAVFFAQLWHVGRASHQHYQPNEEQPISASSKAVGSGEQVFSPKSMQMEDYPAPRQLDASELPAIVEQYRVAARNALDAGFDGVEVHGANGYLIDQFLKDGINDRTDDYGGPIENRCRFALEVMKAVCEEVGSEKVGLRLSPFGGFLDAHDSHPYALNIYLLEELNKMNLAYVHLIEPRVAGSGDRSEGNDSIASFRSVYNGTLISAGGFNAENGAKAIASGHCDLVCYGRLFLANPDLPRRFQLGAPLNKYDRNTFYSQGTEGYTDYPFLEETAEGKQFLATLDA